MKKTDLIDEIKRANPIEQVIKEYIPDFKGVQGDCPWHDSENHACFNIQVRDQFFNCFHCNEKGDVINFVMKFKGVTFIEALRILAKRAGIALPDWSEEEQDKYDKQQRVYDILTEAADYFSSEGAESLNVANRMEKGWGINGDMVDEFKIGWSPDQSDLIPHLRSRGFSDEEIALTGLYEGIWKNRIVFPYWKSGRVRYFISRATELTAKIKDKNNNPIDAPKYIKMKSNQFIKNDFFYGEDYARGAEELFITEGVTDCISAIQAGLNCISPVTVRFKDDDFEKTLRLCRNAKKVYIVNDNEENDAGLKGALDTVRFLIKNGIDAYICILPRDPSLPKVDLNDYLKNHTKDDFLKDCLTTAQTYIEYQINQIPSNTDKFKLPALLNDILLEIAELNLNELGELKYINVLIKERFHLKEKDLEPYRKIFRRHQRALAQNPDTDDEDFIGDIKKVRNRYWVMRRGTNGSNVEVPISNFIINILSQHSTREGMLRQVQFVREDGKISGPFVLEPKDMIRNDSFSQYCVGKGKFVWNGNPQDLAGIWSTEFEQIDDKVVNDIDHMGWIRNENIWAFDNIAVTEDGRSLKPDATGVFWDKDRGIKPKSIIVSSEKLSYGSLSEECPVTLEEILEKFSDSMGSNSARTALGWVAAVPFMEDIMFRWQSFPFLFLTGKYQSGKSTIMSWLMSFFYQDPKHFTVSETTNVAIQRYLSYYSCLPVFLDEYANESKIKSKEPFFRSVYRRDSAGKGIRSEFGVREGEIRGTLAIAGETTPTDAALISRCIKISVSALERHENHVNWFIDNKKFFSFYFLELLKKRQEKAGEFLEIMAKYDEKLKAIQGIEARVSQHYALVLAGSEILFGESPHFYEFVKKEAKDVNIANEQQSAVVKFLEDLNTMKAEGVFKHSGPMWAEKAGTGYLYVQGLYHMWTKDLRQRGEITRFDKTAIMTHLKEDPGFESAREKYRVGKQPVWCMTFNLAICDERIRNLVEEDSAQQAPDKNWND
jgi:DNA primase catalytic core